MMMMTTEQHPSLIQPHDPVRNFGAHGSVSQSLHPVCDWITMSGHVRDPGDK